MDQDYALTPSKYLLPPEQQHLEALLDKHRESDVRNTTMLLLMLKAGCRPGEVLNLTWGDFNISAKTLYLRTTKGGKPRNIPLKRDLLARLIALGPGEPGEKIFDIGYSMFGYVWREYRPVKKKLHSLRHTFAVNLYNRSKFNLRLVQSAMGHRNIRTTAIYLEIEMSNSELRQAID